MTDRAAPRSTRVESLVRAALAAAEDETASVADRAEMLMELAMMLQQQPKTPDHLDAALALYEHAIALCPPHDRLLQARITARRATALQSLPEQGIAALEQARKAYADAIPVLADAGRPEEIAEVEMNLGLVLQTLAGAGRARLTDAISAYQRALRVFDRRRFPVEFAILQNNLATAFLAIPLTDKRGKMREALAVQAFEEGLKVVNLIEHPLEYAMLQNNLGNALQCASSRHALENNLRAIEAYDEALKVRCRKRTPLEYANTIANKANCLCNLRADPSEGHRVEHLQTARSYYLEAHDLFVEHGEPEKANIIEEALRQLAADTSASVGSSNPMPANLRICDAGEPVAG